MYIGWTTYFKQRFQSKRAGMAVGVSLSAETATFTALRSKGGESFVVSEVSVLYSQWQAQLSKWVAKQKLSGAECHVALAQNWYQLLQIDRPDVKDDEINDSLVWPVKELMGFDKPMVLDYFDLPVPLAGNKKVNVVAMPEDTIKEIVAGCIEANVRLESISVEELAHCALLPVMQEPVITLTQEAGEEIILNVVKDGHLYLSRRLKGFENLGSFSAEELRMGVLDSLCIQIQRSMDFFESQLRQAPVRKVMIRINAAQTAIILEQISQAVSAEVTELDLGGVVNDPSEVISNLSSLGMALTPARNKTLSAKPVVTDEK